MSPAFDAAYEAWRNSKIPAATVRADAECGLEPTNRDEVEAWRARWDAAFLRAMTRLTTDPFLLQSEVN